MTLWQFYTDAVAQHKLHPDPAQERVIRALDELALAVQDKPKTFSLFKSEAPIKGLYIYGGVGRGKTMLMNEFLAQVQGQGVKAERWHFHEFMLEIHRNLRAISGDEVETRVQKLADTWAKRLHILCFDEFHVTDVADAMIMMPLFTQLFTRGTIVVATSNWAPDDLYSGGLQRARFLPFITTLKNHMRVIQLGGTQDYRQHVAQQSGWLSPLNAHTAEDFETQFRAAVGYDPIETHEIHIGSADAGRSWVIPRASKQIAWLDMAQILNQAVGAEDFLALAGRYKTLFLDNLLPFSLQENERAKRFMVMIDALYDGGVKLVVRAETPAMQLYPTEGRLQFEFLRTLSRLQEMVSI